MADLALGKSSHRAWGAAELRCLRCMAARSGLMAAMRRTRRGKSSFLPFWRERGREGIALPSRASPYMGKSGRDGEPPPRGAPWETANAWRSARSSPAALSKRVVYDKQQEQQCANQPHTSAVNTTTILSCLKFLAPLCRSLPTATRHPHGAGKSKICFGNHKTLRADEMPTLFKYDLNLCF